MDGSFAYVYILVGVSAAIWSLEMSHFELYKYVKNVFFLVSG